MDTSTSCYSTSTSAPLKLDLRLLDGAAFRFDMTRFRVAWIRSILTAHVTTVACPYKELSGHVCMQIQVHENALSEETSSGGAQLRTLLLHKNTFSGVHESGGYVFLTLFFRSP